MPRCSRSWRSGEHQRLRLLHRRRADDVCGRRSLQQPRDVLWSPQLRLPVRCRLLRSELLGPRVSKGPSVVRGAARERRRPPHASVLLERGVCLRSMTSRRVMPTQLTDNLVFAAQGTCSGAGVCICAEGFEGVACDRRTAIECALRHRLHEVAHTSIAVCRCDHCSVVSEDQQRCV